MVKIGYTIMGEQAGPKQLVDNARRAEEVGFDFIAASDHHNPWLAEQGHSPYVWSVLGAVAQVTERIELMTYVTCPTMRYHPAVVAQKAATVQLLCDGRFTLGLGSGEHLNEHVTGQAWPHAEIRQEMLEDALRIIGPLLDGETVTYRGKRISTEDAVIWDRPSTPPRIAIAASGPSSCKLAGEYGDALIAVAPEAELGQLFDAAGGTGKPRIGQVGVSYDEDEQVAIERAHREGRWALIGDWSVMAELSTPDAFDAACGKVRPEDIAEAMPCGPDVAKHVRAVQKFVDAGFTHVAINQTGAENQDGFLDWASRELLPALREVKAAA